MPHEPADPKRLPNIKSEITYLGVGIKPKSRVQVNGRDPTYFVLHTRDEMLSLQNMSANTIVYVSGTKETFVFSVSRNLWMLVDINC